MQSALITGSAGFIGRHLLLAQRFRVVGLDSHNDRYSPRLKADRVAQLVTRPRYAAWYREYFASV